MASTSGPDVATDIFYAEPLILALIAGLLAVAVFFIVRKFCRRSREFDINDEETAHIPVSVLTAPTEPVSGASSMASGSIHVVPRRTASPRIKQPAPIPVSMAQSTSALPDSSCRATSMTPPKNTPHVASVSQAPPVTPIQSATSTVTPGTRSSNVGPPLAVALHNATTRPTPLTPPPSAGYSSSIASTVTVDSAKSITPRRSTSCGVNNSGKTADTQAKQLVEQRSEDAPEISETGDMLAVNKMTNDDLKRMMSDRGERNPPMRRPQPLSAEVLTDASTTQKLIPTQPSNLSPRKVTSDENRSSMYSQEHVIDIQRTPSRLQNLIATTNAGPPSEKSGSSDPKNKKLSAEPLKSDKTQPEHSDQKAYTPGNKDEPATSIRKF